MISQKPNETGRKVFDLLKKAGFSSVQAMFITAQAAHETGNFTSNVFRNANNLFGFKFIGHPLETASYNDYGVYKSIEDCVIRYKDYYKKKNWPDPFSSVEQFVSSLKANNYFEAPYNEYLNGVKSWMKVYFG